MPSIFASYYTATLPIPTDPDHTITIQKLSGRAIEQAQFTHLQNTVAGRPARGWAAMFQQALKNGTATDHDAQKALDDPLNGFDRLAIAKAGIRGWSYTEQNADGVTVKKPVTPQAIEDIDDETLEWAAREIMRLTRPALFETEETQGTAQKNDSRPSTAA